jgi:hypothetical protein
MKRIIAVLLLAASLGTVAVAEELPLPGAYFKAGPVQFTYPLANASAIALYDFWLGEGLMGAETSIAQAWDCLNINFGAVTSFQANGMPFVSIDYKMDDTLRLPSRIGLWYGHDFKTNDNRAGVKASVPLW